MGRDWSSVDMFPSIVKTILQCHNFEKIVNIPQFGDDCIAAQEENILDMRKRNGNCMNVLHLQGLLINKYDQSEIQKFTLCVLFKSKQ